MKKTFLLCVMVLIVSCNDINIIEMDKIKQVKVGISTNEMKYLLGEPYDIEINNGYEEWYFRYRVCGHKNTFNVRVQNSKVIDFQSY